MKQIAVIHTVQSVADTFGAKLKEYLGGNVKIYNIWDDFLAINANELGEFTMNNKNRLFGDIKNAELTGADLIVLSCSTLTPHLDNIRPFISVPVVAIDDAMTETAVGVGKKILVVATAQSTLAPTTDKLYCDAKRAGREITIDHLHLPEAFKALQANDMVLHDKLVLEAAEKISGYDCIVLAQASLAPCEKKIQEITGIPTLSSPELCMKRVKEEIEKLDAKS